MFIQFDGTTGKHTSEGRLYNNMMSRGKKVDGVYKYTTVSDNFQNFQYFAEWCNSQIGFNEKDDYNRNFSLDKDLLLYGNNQYCEDLCVFVPSEINTFILKGSNTIKINGLPTGVCVGKHDNRWGFMSYCSVPWSKHMKRAGPYTTIKKAYEKYSTTKEHVAKYLASKWESKIDPRVFEMLMKFKTDSRGYCLNSLPLHTTYHEYSNMDILHDG